MRKTITMLIGAAMLPMATLASAQAPAYPDKPIRIVVPFPVGGIADLFGREIAKKLTEAWGQPVVIDNRAGAGGNIGADIVAKSAPDGYTLVIGSIGTHAVNVSLFPSMPFDPIKDFTPIVHLLDAEGLLVVNPSLTPSTSFMCRTRETCRRSPICLADRRLWPLRPCRPCCRTFAPESCARLPCSAPRAHQYCLTCPLWRNRCRDSK